MYVCNALHARNNFVRTRFIKRLIINPIASMSKTKMIIFFKI
jgi:hypothetical protein